MQSSVCEYIQLLADQTEQAYICSYLRNFLEPTVKHSRYKTLIIDLKCDVNLIDDNVPFDFISYIIFVHTCACGHCTFCVYEKTYRRLPRNGSTVFSSVNRSQQH